MPMPIETIFINQYARLAFQYDDGGRTKAGYGGDCVTRAVAIAAQMPYQEVFEAIHNLAQSTERITKRRKRKSNPAMSVRKATSKRYIRSLGWKYTPTMGIGTGCRVHLRAHELPSGRLIVHVSKHLVAVIDGVIHDTYNPDREGTRCVYGYWSKE